MLSKITESCLLTVLAACVPSAPAGDPDRDFTGAWVLDAEASEMHALPDKPDLVLTVSQQKAVLEVVGASGTWAYPTDGVQNKYRVGGATMSSRTKWEGTALLTNTLVSGAQHYVVMDRWRLSKDRNVLTIKRQVMRGAAEAEGVLVYRRKGQTQIAEARDSQAPTPGLTQRPTPQAPEHVVIAAGTRIPLALVSSLSTKHSRDGDRVYLETIYPVMAGGRIVVPRRSQVAGTVTTAKRPGRVSGKGELFIRFDSLTLPNGVTRDFRSRLGSADAGAGSVDREEGKITSPGGKGDDARRVGEAAGAGAGVGTLAGAASGHYGMGAGIGAAAGAAAGLASVLLGRGPDAVLPKGTTLEMILDRDVQFRLDELP